MNRREYIHSRKNIRKSKNRKRTIKNTKRITKNAKRTIRNAKRTIKNTKRITKNANRTINKRKYKKSVLKKYSGGYANNITVEKIGSFYKIRGSFYGKQITDDLNLPLKVSIPINIDKKLQDFYNFRNEISFDKSYILPSWWYFNSLKRINNFLVRVNYYMYQVYTKSKTYNANFCKNYQIYRDFLLGDKYSKYKELKVLGRGASGTVSLVELDGKNYVCKKAHPGKAKAITKFYLDQFSEVQTMRCLLGSHFNVQFKEYITFGPHGANNYLIFEYGECSLLDVIKKQTNFSLKKDSQILFAQIATGIQEMHSLGFYHRDLKVANIIVTSSGNVKITDYGYTTNMESSENIRGTLNSMPIPVAIRTRFNQVRADINHLPDIPNKYWKLNFYDWWGYINIVWQIEKYLRNNISQGGLFNDVYIKITKDFNNTYLLPTIKEVLENNKEIIEQSEILKHLLNYNPNTWDNILGDIQLDYNKMDIDTIEKRCTLIFVDYFGFESLETSDSALNVNTPTSTTTSTQDVLDDQIGVSTEMNQMGVSTKMNQPKLAKGGSPYGENSELIGRECNDLKQRDNMYRYPNIPIFKKVGSEYTSGHFNFTLNEAEYSGWERYIRLILQRFTMYNSLQYPDFQKNILKSNEKFGVDVRTDDNNYPTIFKSSDNLIKPGMFVYGYKKSEKANVISLKGEKTLPDSAVYITIRAFIPENILLHDR